MGPGATDAIGSLHQAWERLVERSSKANDSALLAAERTVLVCQTLTTCAVLLIATIREHAEKTKPRGWFG